MPSPAMTAIRALTASRSGIAPSSNRKGLFVARDRGLLRTQVTQLVDAIEQAVARETLDLEGHFVAAGHHDAVAFEVDQQFDAGVGEQPGGARRVDDDGQQAILERVAAEDIG